MLNTDTPNAKAKQNWGNSQLLCLLLPLWYNPGKVVINMDMEMTGNDHDIKDTDPLELAEIKRRWKPYIDQLQEYAYICDDLLRERK